jgi:hypothetical protein
MYTKRRKVRIVTKKRKVRRRTQSKNIRKKRNKTTTQNGGDLTDDEYKEYHDTKDYPHNPSKKQLQSEQKQGLFRDNNGRLPYGIDPDPGKNEIRNYTKKNRDGLRAHLVNIYLLRKAREIMGWNKWRFTDEDGTNMNFSLKQL